MTAFEGPARHRAAWISPLRLVSLLGLAAMLALPAAPAAADPPPWAPAHGWRAKHDHRDALRIRLPRIDLPVIEVPVIVDPVRVRPGRGDRGRDHRAILRRGDFYALPLGIAAGRCDRSILGHELATGAIGDSIAGATGAGGLAAALGGILVGTIVDQAIGGRMDVVDHACLAQVLERADGGRRVSWVNPDYDTRYSVTPTPLFRRGGLDCREFQTETRIGRRTVDSTAIACRLPDGTWQILG